MKSKLNDPIIKLEKPTPVESIMATLQIATNQNVNPWSLAMSLNEPEYLYWDKAKFVSAPSPLTPEQAWHVVKFMRSTVYISTPVRAVSLDYFRYLNLPRLQQFQHTLDLGYAGQLVADRISTEAERQRYVTRGIMEEAIASSQLEGANTTRRAAKQMLIEKRAPRNRSEQMILNNYTAMKFIEERDRTLPFTLRDFTALHEMLTRDTLEDGRDVGRLRDDNDDIVVSTPDSQVVHVAPNPKFYLKELERCLEYANDKPSDAGFVHPCVKAIILHFWIGYLHPFVDGNGRIARTMFYWYMLKKGYWGMSYLPLSRIIRKSPVQYGMAYLYSEQDDFDLTYFIDYNTRKISQAMREFDQYLARKRDENVRLNSLAKAKYKLNERQALLLRYLLKNASATTTISTHTKVHSVSRLTAQHDLRGLERQGFLRSEKKGRDVLFYATGQVELLLK